MLETDFLVIGSGIAGLWYAYKVADKGRVIIITKKEKSESNTNYAQGGIAVAVGKDDSPKLHIEDTLRAGEGLCDKEIVEKTIYETPKLLNELEQLGIEFSKDENGFHLGREGGHSRPRIVHVKDRTGSTIEQGLLKKIKDKGIKIFENHFAVDLFPTEKGSILTLVIDKQNKSAKIICAKIVFLATGGLCWVYDYTTNPKIATGDGVAMGYRIKAKIANLEFIQFHPTTLYQRREDGTAFLISEAVRGEGALLKTLDGERFMKKYHPKGELATRDIVARAVFEELKKRNENYVLLDLSPLPEKRIKERFPHIYETCLSMGIDITKVPIPVVSAAHYSVGGIKTGLHGETNVPNLLAAGETACTGFHGANRLASNSLIEALVFANNAATYSGKIIPEKLFCQAFPKENYQLVTIKNKTLLQSYIADLKKIMWEKVGIIRNDKELEEAIDKIKKIEREIDTLYPSWILNASLQELRNMLIVAYLIAQCSLLRKESRGLYFNTDHPKNCEEYKRDTIIVKH